MHNYQTQLFFRALTTQRGRNLATLLRCSSWALTLALLFIAAPRAAAAGGSAVTDWMTFPTLSVASDGDSYTTSEGFASGWEARFQINARGAARVKSWTFYPILGLSGVPGFQGLPRVELSGYALSKSYSFGQRPKDVDQTIGRVFPNAVVNDFAAAVCNRNLENLMNQGLSRRQVLSQDRGLVLSGGLHSGLSVDLTLGEATEEVSIHDLEITCQRSPFKPVEPGAGGLTATTKFRLDNATLEISPSLYKGACPKNLTLTMEVQGNLSDMFEARIESTEGWKSTKIALKTNEFDEGSGLWGREFAEPFTLPLDYPNGGGIQPGPGDFAPNPGKEKGGGGVQAVGGLTAADPGWNVHQQSLRLVATANGETVYSDWQQYRVTCDPKPAVPTPSGDLAPGTGAGSDPPKPKPSPAPSPQPQGDPTRLGTKGASRQSASSKDTPSTKPPSAQAGTPEGQRPTRSADKPDPAKPDPSKPGEHSNRETAKPDSKPPTPNASLKKKAKPDLQVLGARASATQPGGIDFLVGNTGDAASTRSAAALSCGGRVGGSKSWDAPIPAIPAGGKEWIRSSTGKRRGASSRAVGCTIRLDPKNAVDESDEGNNSHSCKECQAGF